MRQSVAGFWLAVLLGVALLMIGHGQADAWVAAPYPTNVSRPHGGLTVVGPFCHVADCTQEAHWTAALQAAIAAWNDAGSNFRFTYRAPQLDDDPCYTRVEEGKEGVFVTFATPETVCQKDRGVFDSAAVMVMGWPGRAYYIHINLAQIHPTDIPRVTRFLIYELGHTLGLDHPDEAGQRVPEIMNSNVIYNTLQPDDIAGIRALYGVRPVKPQGLVGHLENPSDGAFASGISLVSGWVCEAETVEIQIWAPTGGPVIVAQAAYGTDRGDTLATCGDTNNGFGLMFNWNLRGDGEHIVDLLVDGEHLDRAMVTVTTLGTEFLTGVEGEGIITLSNGKRVRVA